jgi:hypothetical protein
VSSTRCSRSWTELGYPVGRPPRGSAIRTIQIEAPTSGAATLLVRDLVPFARTDVVPLDDERWEVRVEESTDDELDAVLLAVARWAAAYELERRPVLVDGEPVELPDPS